jgi:hypothetical protein
LEFTEACLQAPDGPPPPPCDPAHERLWSLAGARHRGRAGNAPRACAMPARPPLVQWGRPLTGALRPGARETGGHFSRIRPSTAIFPAGTPLLPPAASRCPGLRPDRLHRAARSVPA